MARFNHLPFVLAAASIAPICLHGQAQTTQDNSPGAPREKVVTDAPRPMPFPPVLGDAGRPHSIEVRPLDQMTEQDRNLAADAEASIGEHAGFVGLEFNRGKWAYQQLMCPVFPNHIFLRFTRNNGVGDVSLFSASVPRGGEGRVRIIPIQMRGYSLFSPAPVNALTISAFNHIRAEEHPDGSSDWLQTALCYAALAGGKPQAWTPVDPPDGQAFTAPMSSVLEIPVRGGAIIRFMDVSTMPRPRVWTMTFDGKGKLLKAGHAPADLVNAKVVHPAPVDEKGKPRD
jgi:hypothetical protein